MAAIPAVVVAIALGLGTGVANAAMSPASASADSTSLGSGTSIIGCRIETITTSTLIIGPSGGQPTGGTILKTSPGCRDITLLSAPPGRYEGWLENTATGRWIACTPSVPSPPPNRVLCADVVAGTTFTVVASGNQVKITISF